jgi:hypothetical protein
MVACADSSTRRRPTVNTVRSAREVRRSARSEALLTNLVKSSGSSSFERPQQHIDPSDHLAGFADHVFSGQQQCDSLALS